ncbi:MAG: NADH-quinone oxidoreductase subunit M, partial [Chloroflexi bacterium]
MEYLNTHLLSLILFTPAVAALIMLFMPNEAKLHRWFAFVASLIPFLLTLVLWSRFDPNVAGFQLEEKYVWYEALNSSFHLGVDGISFSMVLLTTLLTPLAILASFSVTDRVKPYMMLFLFLETGMLGVFLALDLLIFFV